MKISTKIQAIRLLKHVEESPENVRSSKVRISIAHELLGANAGFVNSGRLKHLL